MITGVHLITGLIGSGKTLRAVDLIDQEVKRGRAVYVCNINGLTMPGVIPFDDPKQWQDLPAGSLLVVDEAQRFWRSRRSAEVPPELQAMETSRHDAVSFVVLTQQPTYLDKHLRGLVTRHEHLFRRMNAAAASLYSWERCHDEPMCPSSKDGADESIYTYPKRLYGAYKSAEQHTVKLKIGLRMKLVAVAVVLILSIVGWIGWDLKKRISGTKAAPIAGAPPQAETRNGPAPYDDADSYGQQQVPRLSSQPWSAPIYDGRKVQAKPIVMCMSTRSDCMCMTEQGTRYQLDSSADKHDELCRSMARTGATYNPYKEPDRQERQRANDRDRDRADQRPLASDTERSPHEAFDVGDGRPVATYGAFRGAP
jgi:hypothetical protein